ncbi:hypothetical protein A3Q56_05790 [Intoshia linei]|uniref:Uncharacterized protein n=1 Tax=Intoshia linei TaxID=1819745 RepID=A0A177AWT9_9BILA|nr:hypothetical protein A3Q56_05790 [Intoshia linei]
MTENFTINPHKVLIVQGKLSQNPNEWINDFDDYIIMLKLANREVVDELN